MARETVTVFHPYPFEVGQKIHIASGPRLGDWEVTGVTEKKVRLRCPLSGREVEWDNFCYFVEKLDNAEWPKQLDP